MAKIVGLSRNIKLNWISYASSVLNDVTDINEAKKMLNDYLAAEIKSPDNLRKTKDILINIWLKSDDELRKEAFRLVEKYPEDKIVIFWCMLLSVYPVFDNICNTMGKIYKFQDEISLSQLKDKMFDQWGERTTLYHSIDKIAATMKSLECVKATKGKYTKVNHEVLNEDISNFIALTYLKTVDSSYTSLEDINDWDAMFPFNYKITREMISLDDRYQITAFDGKPVITLNK